MVAAMRTGKLLVLNVGTYTPDFINDYTSDEASIVPRGVAASGGSYTTTGYFFS